MDERSYKIVIIGAGNLATNLGKALHAKGYCISQVYSRTKSSAESLAGVLATDYVTDLEQVRNDADLYIVSLKDSALVELIPEIVSGRQNALFIHTAGSVPMNIWEGNVPRYGVFYPMQTFSKSREVDFKDIPVFLEAVNEADLGVLHEIASDLSSNVREATSEQRRYLHLSAVFACNFTNHMYALAETLLAKYNLPFDVMLPLIDETACKVHELSPVEAQTGPAVRYDENVIDKLLELLSDEPEMRELYEKISKNIYKLKSGK